MNDTISRQAAIDYFVTNVGFHDEDGHPIEDEEELREIWTGYFDGIPPAQQNLSEEYAKAVRNWLVNYQIKCAELNGRYTPYEVLGWIVSDWRKENGIW